jgi:hypothetical protein
MLHAPDTLEDTIAKLRQLSPDKQAVAVELIDELVSEPDVYELSAEELAILEPEIAGADAGEFATDEEVARSILRPWS